MSGPRPVEYVLFDMDGLMLDSERVYTDVTNKLLEPFGKEMTWEMKAGCMGKPEREAAMHLLSFFPDIDLPLETYLKERNILQDQAWPHVPLLPGVERLVKHLKKHNIPIAVATGSRRSKFELKTVNHQDVFGLFEGKVVCGDDLKYGMRGKPNPDIFIGAARAMLGRDVGDALTKEEDLAEEQRTERAKGLVFEDGMPGMQAGKRAGMTVCWIPDSGLLNVEYDGPERADQILRSMEEFVPEEWGLPPFDREP